jgi:undecaprenyl-diphosphatase
MSEKLYSLDLNLLFALNHNHTPLLDWLMWHFSGNLLWLPLYLLIIFLITKQFKRLSIWLIIIAIAAVGTSDLTSVHLFKETIQRLRPCHNPHIMNQIILVHNHCGGMYGFFSSHASNTFTLAMFTSLLLRRNWISALMFIWALLVSISRVYLGVHYPSDILAGAIWGMIIGGIFYVISKSLILKTHGQSQNR